MGSESSFLSRFKREEW
jgi:hypothetical protein